MINKLFFATLSILLLTVSCNKLPNNNPPATAASPTPVFANSGGVFVAVSTLTYQTTIVGEFPVDIDVATGGIYDAGSTTYVPAGAVSVNSNSLEMSTNNAYVSVSGTTANVDLGFDNSSLNSWVIGGSASVPAFNFTTSRAMPSNIKFNAEVDKINTANSYTIAIDVAPSNADSILYVLAANNKTLTKTVAPSTTSVTFTSAEMSGLSGSGVAQVAAYNYEMSVQNGRNIYFVNEVVITDFVTFK